MTQAELDRLAADLGLRGRFARKDPSLLAAARSLLEEVQRTRRVAYDLRQLSRVAYGAPEPGPEHARAFYRAACLIDPLDPSDLP